MRRACSAATASPTARCDSPRLPAGSGPSISRPVRSGASAGSGRFERPRDRRQRRAAGAAHHAFDRGRARLSDERRRAGKPAAHVRRVLGTDGAAERHRAHEAARRAAARRSRGVPAARLRVLEPRSHALHRILRPGPREGRHPAEPADGAGAECRTVGDARHQPRVARSTWAAAEGRVQAGAARRPCRGRSRWTRPRGASSRRRLSGGATASSSPSPSRSITAC